MSHPLCLENVHSLWRNREELSPGAGTESGRGGLGSLAPYLAHNLRRAHLASMDGPVNAILYCALKGEETGWLCL